MSHDALGAHARDEIGITAELGSYKRMPGDPTA